MNSHKRVMKDMKEEITDVIKEQMNFFSKISREYNEPEQANALVYLSGQALKTSAGKAYFDKLEMLKEKIEKDITRNRSYQHSETGDSSTRKNNINRVIYGALIFFTEQSAKYNDAAIKNILIEEADLAISFTRFGSSDENPSSSYNNINLKER